jgi:cytochrome c553
MTDQGQWISDMLKALLLLTALFSASAAFAEGDIILGKAKSAICATCHGPDGNGGVNDWPKLAGQHASYLIKQLRDYRLGAKDGRNNSLMTGMATSLSDADILDLAAYYASQLPTIDAAERQYVDLGQRLYRGGDRNKGIAACTACHGPTGRGNAEAYFPAVGGQHAGYVVSQLQAFRAGKRSNDFNHMMRDIASKMSDQEMTAVASYIAGLH